MARDDKLAAMPATRADVATVAITASLATQLIHNILFAIKHTGEVNEVDLNKLQAASDRLDEQFEKLVGWTRD